MDMLAHIARQRREIAGDLAVLTPDQWDTESCCTGWSVLDVAAHLTYGWHSSLARNMWRMARAGGNLDIVNARNVAELRAAGGPAVAADLEANVDHPFKPPGLGYAAPLIDLVIHRRDMFLPLGITYDADLEAVRVALDKATARGMFGMVNSHRRLSGLSFRATDLDWSHGTGPQVVGPGLPLAHAMWGRTQSLDELGGEGVDILRSRLSS